MKRFMQEGFKHATVKCTLSNASLTWGQGLVYVLIYVPAGSGWILFTPPVRLSWRLLYSTCLCINLTFQESKEANETSVKRNVEQFKSGEVCRTVLVCEAINHPFYHLSQCLSRLHSTAESVCEVISPENTPYLQFHQDPLSPWR